MNKGENILRILLAILSITSMLVGVYGWIHEVEGWGWFLAGTFILICLLASTYEDGDEKAPPNKGRG